MRPRTIWASLSPLKIRHGAAPPVAPLTSSRARPDWRNRELCLLPFAPLPAADAGRGRVRSRSDSGPPSRRGAGSPRGCSQGPWVLQLICDRDTMSAPRAFARVPVSLSPGVGQEHFSYFPGSYHAIIVTISPNNRLDTALTGAQLTLAQATAWSRRTRGQNSGMIHPGRSRSPWGTPPHASTSQPSKARWSSPRRQEGAEFIGAHGPQK
jgi:hypothetical protein